jgi:Flp pilus assembly protein TadD
LLRILVKHYSNNCKDLADAYHYKGRVNQAKGDFARAIPDFTMAIKLDSADSDAKSDRIAEHWNFCG